MHAVIITGQRINFGCPFLRCSDPIFLYSSLSYALSKGKIWERYERKKKRVSHTADFKAKVGLEAIRSDQTINEIAQLYDVYPAQVAQWKKAILD